MTVLPSSSPRLSSQDRAKRDAAEAAAACVPDGAVLGLGTGSTMMFAIRALGRRRREERLRVRCLPSSVRTARAAAAEGLPLIDFDACVQLDLSIDGTDEVQPGSLALIKGLGGALLREKIIAVHSARFVVIADESKIVASLGEKAPVPVEVVEFGHPATRRALAALGADPVLRITADGAPFVTDGGHWIYDCHGLGPIADPCALNRALRDIVGVVETGLFIGLASEAYIAAEDGVVRCLTVTKEDGL